MSGFIVDAWLKIKGRRYSPFYSALIRTIFWSFIWVIVLFAAAFFDGIIAATISIVSCEAIDGADLAIGQVCGMNRADAMVEVTSEVNATNIVEDIKRIELSASAVAYSYIGSVGAEAAIRAFDERNLHNSNRTFRGIGFNKLFICLLLSLIIALVSAISEMVGQAYGLSYIFFSSKDLGTILFDKKLLIIFSVCSCLRVYIYHDGRNKANTPSNQTLVSS